MKTAFATMKNITLETGGKSPLLVFNDALVEQAVKWSHGGIKSRTPARELPIPRTPAIEDVVMKAPPVSSRCCFDA
jgi:hypothetical protein